MQIRNYITIIIALFLFVGQGFFCSAQTKVYNIDQKHSEIRFQIKHLGVLTIEGQFKDFLGTLVYKDNNLSQLESVIEVNSLDTSDKKRDVNALEEGFLDAQTFPHITFKSKEISKNTISGNLKIKDIERKIMMSYSFLKSNSNNHIILITTILSRKEFKLHFGPMNALIGDEIKVNLKIVFKRN